MSFFLDDLEFSGNENTISGVLQNFGIELTDDLKSSIASTVSGDTNLAQSIRFDIETEKDGYRFRLYVPEYGTYLDEGVQGIGGRKKSGGSWINKGIGSRFSFNQGKGNKPRLQEKGSIQGLGTWSTSRGLNKWAVQNAVWHQGIKKTEWFSKVYDENLTNELIKKLESVGAKQMELGFVKFIENGTNN